MNKKAAFSTLLGIDLGWANTRVSLFGIKNNRFNLVDCENAQTTLDPTFDYGHGVVEALRKLEKKANYALLDGFEKIIKTKDATDKGVQQVALTTSVSPWPRTVLVGLTEHGSLQAGRTLTDSLPLNLIQSLGMDALVDQPRVIETLVHNHPEIFILTGGENGGATGLMQDWVDVLRIYCRLIPPFLKPTILFAGNPALEESIKRYLEPLTRLKTTANLLPLVGEMDLLPAQAALDQEIFRIWKKKSPSLAALSFLAKNLEGTKSFYLGRSVRWLAHNQGVSQSNPDQRGVLAYDLGAGTTTISAASGDEMGTVLTPHFGQQSEPFNEETIRFVHAWCGVACDKDQVVDFLSRKSILPELLPETKLELALSQALTRLRLRQGLEKFAQNYPWLVNDPREWLSYGFGKVFISGEEFILAPTPGQLLMTLLDGFQPRGLTTFLIDQHQLLPLLGIIGGMEPILPVHVLKSNAFTNLGTVICPLSNARPGKTILSFELDGHNGTKHAGEIQQGKLTRIDLPMGEVAKLTLHPKRGTDLGIGDQGMRGSPDITGGQLGLVIDARGRPVKLAEEGQARLNQLQGWLGELGG